MINFALSSNKWRKSTPNKAHKLDGRFSVFIEVVLPVALLMIEGYRAGKVGVKLGWCRCSVLVFHVSHFAAASYARR